MRDAARLKSVASTHSACVTKRKEDCQLIRWLYKAFLKIWSVSLVAESSQAYLKWKPDFSTSMARNYWPAWNVKRKG